MQWIHSVVPVTYLSVSHEKSIAMKIILYYKTKQKQNYDINKKKRGKGNNIQNS